MALQSSVRVDSIVNLAGTGPVELTYGATIPAGEALEVQGNINLTGVTTVGQLSSTNLTATNIVANSFVGDGSSLTGLPTVDSGKAIAIALIS
jgi:hypothetical protein